jgi:hypothetical protein
MTDPKITASTTRTVALRHTRSLRLADLIEFVEQCNASGLPPDALVEVSGIYLVETVLADKLYAFTQVSAEAAVAVQA